jgi:hypothetical protein
MKLLNRNAVVTLGTNGQLYILRANRSDNLFYPTSRLSVRASYSITPASWQRLHTVLAQIPDKRPNEVWRVTGDINFLEDAE